MSDMESIYIIKGNTCDWEGWSEKFLPRSKKKGHRKLLTGKDAIPTAEEYEKVVAESNKSGNNIVRLNDTNKQVFEVNAKQ